ncbi:metallophosphoesterase [Clostridium lundense]|uniref:metallophosphoesterase n=1 Tax=Clostridium lundense TaxID=319475 RepID=UPI0004886162|nr:metallophosphoesterase [Clostridium lundense]
MKIKIKSRWKVLCIICVLLTFFYCENNWLGISNYDLYYDNLSKSFDNYSIIHISDLHSKVFGEKNKILIEKIKKEKPNIIVITGDIIDRRRYNDKPSIEFLKEAVKIAPVYFSTGNHEIWSGKFNELESNMKNIGVKVLRNENVKIDNGKEYIYLLGIDDPGVVHADEEDEVLKENIRKAKNGVDKKNFTILLSHRPERINVYNDENINLVFSGHAHGGQVRIPLIGAIIAPGQGLFPKYTSGAHKLKKGFIVISRGLGNSSIPQRIFNRPELVKVVLKAH